MERGHYCEHMMANIVKGMTLNIWNVWYSFTLQRFESKVPSRQQVTCLCVYVIIIVALSWRRSSNNGYLSFTKWLPIYLPIFIKVCMGEYYFNLSLLIYLIWNEYSFLLSVSYTHGIILVYSCILNFLLLWKKSLVDNSYIFCN